MILLAFVPLLYPPIPPLVDLPGHMGRFHVQMELAHSPLLQRYYEYHWALVGNLGVDLLIIPMAKLFGLELGTKLIVMCIPPLTVAGFLWVAREVHNRIPPTALFALPFAFGHPFMFGFVNFALSMALAFLAFGLWLRLGRLGKERLRLALFVPISFIMFICHAFGWGALGLMCFSAEAVRQHDQGRSWWRAALNAGSHAACMAGPLLILFAWRHEAQGGGNTSDWFDWTAKQLWIVSALRDRWSNYDRYSVYFSLGMLGLALFLRRLVYSRNLAFSSFVLLLIYILMPRIVFGSAFADMRLVPFLIAVALLSIRFREATHLPTARVLAIVGLAFYVLRIGATTASMAIASNDEQRELVALDRLPTGSRVLYLVAWNCGNDWPLPRKSQLGAMAIVRKNALVNSEWHLPGAQILKVRNQARLGWFGGDPSQLVLPDSCGTREHWPVSRSLAEFPHSEFDYAWLINMPPFDPRLVAGWPLLYRDDNSMLFRIMPAVPPRVF
jgi:hypothetical protein